MKLSERIAILQVCYKLYGDIEICNIDDSSYSFDFVDPKIVRLINRQFQTKESLEEAKSTLEISESCLASFDKHWLEMDEVSRTLWHDKENYRTSLEQACNYARKIIQEWDSAPKYLLI